MNLFRQTFHVLHKNIGIAIILLVPSLLSTCFKLLFGSLSPITILFSLIFAIAGLFAMVIAIGWSNEALLGEHKPRKMKPYFRFVGPNILLGLIQALIIAVANMGFVVALLNRVPDQFAWNQYHEVEQFVVDQAGLLILIFFVNVILTALFAFSSYALIADDKGIFHALKQSVIFSFKGLVVGFFSGLALVILIIAGIVFIAEITAFNSVLSQFLMIVAASYGEALLTVFMVALYQKLQKSA